MEQAVNAEAFELRAQKRALGTKAKGANWVQRHAAGGPDGIRTHALRVANAALSQLSYEPKCELLRGEYFCDDSAALGWHA